jgi:glycerol uptake facilitator-like aquaporin
LTIGMTVIAPGAGDVLPYWIAQVLGGAAAAFTFLAVNPEDR